MNDTVISRYFIAIDEPGNEGVTMAHGSVMTEILTELYNDIYIRLESPPDEDIWHKYS